MFKQLMLHVIATPLYWFGAICYPQILAYFIASIATAQLVLTTITYTRIKTQQEQEIAHFLSRISSVEK